MKFKIKDLMISALPTGPEPEEDAPCTRCSNCTGCSRCSMCTRATCVHTLTLRCGHADSDPGELVASDLESLKELLREAMNVVAGRERALADQPKEPETADELNLLERQLGEALDEVKKKKSSLKKK